MPESSYDEHNESIPEKPPVAGRKLPGQSWSSLTDERIRAAMERGDFDNLPGAGKPQDLTENPYAGHRGLEFHILKSNNLVPREIALGQEIDAELARAEELLVELRRKRAAVARRMWHRAGNIRAYNTLQEQYARRFETMLRHVNDQILTLNIITPAAMHREQLDVAARMAAFRAEFTPIDE
ncbi:MAG TPA: DnaJ family domain-containing protein [Ktedonobacterales bacterium]|nr:DnaJ family domain-containing protein [Ktedonobacterales bacterium]